MGGTLTRAAIILNPRLFPIFGTATENIRILLLSSTLTESERLAEPSSDVDSWEGESVLMISPGFVTGGKGGSQAGGVYI